MILGSHNSWSYLPVKKWWMRPLAFTARCQSLTIKEQYYRGVRCFDLRIKFNKYGLGIVAHGMIEYCFIASKIYEDLEWLNQKKDCYIRIIHEVRSKKQYTERNKTLFKFFCYKVTNTYENIHFWCGRNLYNWKIDYDFGEEPTCEECYSSVCSPKIIDDWWPWLFAKRKNKEIKAKGTDKDILLIDFVNI